MDKSNYTNNSKISNSLTNWTNFLFNRELDLWESVNANSINGTDGTMFAPFMTHDQKIFSFSPDMCR
jgi:hypothetical protein